MTQPNLIAINAGNSRTQVCLIQEGEITESQRFDNADSPSIVQSIIDGWQSIQSAPAASIVLASVNDKIAGTVESMVEDQLGTDIYRVGEDLPVPVGRSLEPETLTGVDRLLCVAAAYDRLGEACIVVDAGTAVTIDFVDGEGTFHGGAIAPGAAMQLHALHERIAALPEITFRSPDDEAFGRSTSQAMLHGVYHGIRGMVWRMTERYARRYGAFPQVIATGGDAETLFNDDELINTIVPNLAILGIIVAVRHAFNQSDEMSDSR